MDLTIIRVMRELGFATDDPKVTWAIGAAVRDVYEKRFGQLPPKELRRKTAGGGSHCFAIYPDSMRRDIERLIRIYATRRVRTLY